MSVIPSESRVIPPRELKDYFNCNPSNSLGMT
jgi:hypothetical protein